MSSYPMRPTLPSTPPVLRALSTSTVLVVSSDGSLRQSLSMQLQTMRWTVLEAAGGADALMQMEDIIPAAVMLDGWLPDLEAGEFARQIRRMYPTVDLLQLDGTPVAGAPRCTRRHELLHALREVQEKYPTDAPVWSQAPTASVLTDTAVKVEMPATAPQEATETRATRAAEPVFALPEMVGDSAQIRDLARMVRLVAPRSTTVLIEGDTGTGKELVAKAVHRLSERAGKPFVVLNCAAIPEQLLEAELFGHTRGAFTGAVTSRTGRIEAAHGGTLFLDEIGEMPLALQAKMLRFLECGELQRIGDNDVSRVDVRIVAATHQPLEQRSSEGTFRLDLFHRLAVFPVAVPALRERMEDLPMLVTYMLRRMGEKMPQRGITAAAMQRLLDYQWPGNVRELAHVLERGCILSGDRAEIEAGDIRLRNTVRNMT